MVIHRGIFGSVLRLGFRTSLFLLVALNAQANDSDRITTLEKEVQELKIRLTNLETPLASSSSRSKPIASKDGWKSLANWRSVKKGMSTDEVRAVLGEPESVRVAGPLTYWSFPNRGIVTFFDEQLNGWNEPR